MWVVFYVGNKMFVIVLYCIVLHCISLRVNSVTRFWIQFGWSSWQTRRPSTRVAVAACITSAGLSVRFLPRGGWGWFRRWHAIRRLCLPASTFQPSDGKQSNSDQRPWLSSYRSSHWWVMTAGYFNYITKVIVSMHIVNVHAQTYAYTHAR